MVVPATKNFSDFEGYLCVLDLDSRFTSQNEKHFEKAYLCTKDGTGKKSKIGMKFLTTFENKSHSLALKDISKSISSEASRLKHGPLNEKHLFLFAFMSLFVLLL